MNVIEKVITNTYSEVFENLKQLGGVVQCVDTYINPENQSNYNSNTNNIIRFTFPKCDMAVLKESNLQFGATCSATASTYCRFSRGIGTILNRVRVLFGSYLVTDVLNYNLIYTNKLLSQDPTLLTSNMAFFIGWENAVTRDTNATNVNKKYMLDLGFIADILSKNIPLNNISENLIIELYFEQANRCLETDGTAPQYTLTNLEYHYMACTMSQEYKNILKSKIDSTGVQIVYKTYDNFQLTLNTGQTTLYGNIPVRKQLCQDFISMSRNVVDVTTASSNDKFEQYQLYTLYNSMRLKINNTYYPSDRVLNTVDQLNEALNVYSKSLYTPVEFSNNWSKYFTCAYNFDQDPKNDDDADKNIMMGLNLADASSSFIYELVLNTGPVSQQQIDVFIGVFNILSISSNKILRTE